MINKKNTNERRKKYFNKYASMLNHSNLTNQSKRKQKLSMYRDKFDELAKRKYYDDEYYDDMDSDKYDKIANDNDLEHMILGKEEKQNSIKSEILINHLKSKKTLTHEDAIKESHEIELNKLNNLIKMNLNMGTIIDKSIIDRDNTYKDEAFVNIDNFFAILSQFVNTECINKLKGNELEKLFLTGNLTDDELFKLSYLYLTKIQNILYDDCRVNSHIITLENVAISSVVTVLKDNDYILFSVCNDIKFMGIISKGDVIFDSCDNCFNKLSEYNNCHVTILCLNSLDKKILDCLNCILGIDMYLNLNPCGGIKMKDIMEYINVKHKVNLMISHMHNENDFIIGDQSIEFDNEDELKLLLHQIKKEQDLPQLVCGDDFCIIFLPEHNLVHQININRHLRNNNKKNNMLMITYLSCVNKEIGISIREELSCSNYNGDTYGNYKACVPEKDDLKKYILLSLSNQRFAHFINRLKEANQKNINSEQFNKIKENLIRFYS